MNALELKSLESRFFESLNQLIDPMLRAGFGFPCFAPAGAILLETTGRRSGRKRTVPVLATRVGRLLLVSTARSRSQWMKNLAATPDVRYWLGGREYEAVAFVFPLAEKNLQEDIPREVSCLAQTLIPHSKLFGIRFAVLLTRDGKSSDYQSPT